MELVRAPQGRQPDELRTGRTGHAFPRLDHLHPPLQFRLRYIGRILLHQDGLGVTSHHANDLVPLSQNIDKFVDAEVQIDFWRIGEIEDRLFCIIAGVVSA